MPAPKWRIIEPTALQADLLACRIIGTPIGILAALPQFAPEQLDMLGTLEIQTPDGWRACTLDDTDYGFLERQRIRAARRALISEGCDQAFIDDLPVRFAAAMRDAVDTKTGVALPFSPLIVGALASGHCSYLDLRDHLYTRDAVYLCMLSLHTSVNDWIVRDALNRKAR